MTNGAVRDGGMGRLALGFVLCGDGGFLHLGAGEMVGHECTALGLEGIGQS